MVYLIQAVLNFVVSAGMLADTGMKEIDHSYLNSSHCSNQAVNNCKLEKHEGH